MDPTVYNNESGFFYRTMPALIFGVFYPQKGALERIKFVLLLKAVIGWQLDDSFAGRKRAREKLQRTYRVFEDRCRGYA